MPHWLLEGLFIVISVVLGFGVAQFGSYRADRELTARVLAGFETEIQQNLATLEPFVPVHRQWVEALGKAQTRGGDSAFKVFLALRPALPAGAQSSFPFLQRSAWDTAVAGGALRLVDYELVALLSEVYRLQEIVTANVERRLAEGVFSSVVVYEPATPASMDFLRFTLVDVVSAESSLLARYREHLPKIAAAVQAAR